MGTDRVNKGAAGARAAVGALLGMGQEAAAAAVQAAPEAPEAPAAEAPAAPALTEAERGIAVKTLLDAAIVKLDTDPVAGKADIVQLLNGALTLLGDTNASATAMISSTLTLLEVDAAASAASVKTILETVKPML